MLSEILFWCSVGAVAIGLVVAIIEVSSPRAPWDN